MSETTKDIKDKTAPEISRTDKLMVEKIKTARQWLNLSQAQFAKKLNVSRVAVSMWETTALKNGKKVIPSRPSLEKIANLLGCPVGFFESDTIDGNDLWEELAWIHVPEEQRMEAETKCDVSDFYPEPDRTAKSNKDATKGTDSNENSTALTTKYSDARLKATREALKAARPLLQDVNFDKRYTARPQRTSKEGLIANARLNQGIGGLAALKDFPSNASVSPNNFNYEEVDPAYRSSRRKPKSHNFFPTVEFLCDEQIPDFVEKYSGAFIWEGSYSQVFDFCCEKTRCIARYTTLHVHGALSGLPSFVSEINARVGDLLIMEKMLKKKWKKYVCVYDHTSRQNKKESPFNSESDHKPRWLTTLEEGAGVEVIFFTKPQDCADFLLHLVGPSETE